MTWNESPFQEVDGDDYGSQYAEAHSQGYSDLFARVHSFVSIDAYK